jgi:hypothetical protein
MFVRTMRALRTLSGSSSALAATAAVGMAAHHGRPVAACSASSAAAPCSSSGDGGGGSGGGSDAAAAVEDATPRLMLLLLQHGCCWSLSHADVADLLEEGEAKAQCVAVPNRRPRTSKQRAQQGSGDRTQTQARAVLLSPLTKASPYQ